MTLRLLIAALLAAFAVPGTAGAAGWRLAQPAPPTPPPGVPAASYAVPLGGIGDISFWSPNRGLMSVGGNDAVAAGLLRFDGRRWTQLSTVCGGADTKIVWAGPDEFWTLTAPAPDPLAGSTAFNDPRTLCHFDGGAVVASYATTPGRVDSYGRMTAGACATPDDCWFGGPAVNERAGAFHLHWDGRELKAVAAPQSRPVQGMAAFGGQVVEAVSVLDGNTPAVLTNPEPEPVLVHRLAPRRADASAFVDDPFLPAPVAGWPEATSLYALEADGARLWAAGGHNRGAVVDPAIDPPPPARGPLVAIRDGDGPLRELPVDPAAFAPDSYAVRLAPTGLGTAWLGLVGVSDPVSGAVTALAEVDATGAVVARSPLPAPDDPDPNARAVGGGAPSAVACGAPGDCWTGTDDGWLFHLAGGGPPPAIDEDPAFGTLITERPPDGATPRYVPDTLPVDNSGDDLLQPEPPLPPVADPAPEADPGPVAQRIKVKALSRTRLRLSFRLTATATVKARAFRWGKLVSSTKARTLRAGSRSVTLKVSPKRWPTRLDLDVKAPSA